MAGTEGADRPEGRILFVGGRVVKCRVANKNRFRVGASNEQDNKNGANWLRKRCAGAEGALVTDLKQSGPRLLVAAVVTMLTTHALVILASMALPVMAPSAEATLNMPARYIGLYATVLYTGAAISTMFASDLVARFGAVRTSQITVVVAASGLLALAGGTIPLAALSAFLVGLAYGPGNTASGRLLTRLTDEGKRSAIFSIKQTSVPIGAAVAGFSLPLLAVQLGWQGAAVVAALACVAVAFLVQPWHAKLDVDRNPAHRFSVSNLFGPVRTVLRGPRLRAIGIMGLVYAGMQYAFSAVMVAFLVDRAEVGAVEAGMILSAAMVTSVVARLAWGYLADLTRSDVVLTLVGLLTAGSAVAAEFASPEWSRLALVGLGCWFGASGFSWNGVFLALAADIAGPQRVADATSGIMMLVFVGALSFPAIFTGLIAWSGYEAALRAVAAATALTAIYLLVALRLAEKRRKQQV